MMASDQNSWAGVVQLAEKAGAKYPELVAAQWALESGWGKACSGKNNFFGLKGKGDARSTQEYVNGKPIQIVDSFLNFASLEECVNYLVSRWYKDWQGYKGINRASSRDAAARALANQGYATNPAYATKLIDLMNQESKAVDKKVKAEANLYEIEALQATWLKKKPVMAGDLGDKQKVVVGKGKRYGVVKYEEVAADAHAKVELAAGSGTWYVYEPHWKKEQCGAVCLPTEVDWSDFNALVTPSLTVGEVLQWDRRRTPVKPSIKRQLIDTAVQFQNVRDAWGKPLGVTSFYRPEPINSQVGGVPNSRHVSGEAFDVYPVNGSLEVFYQWIRSRWSGGLGDGRNRGFIHLDTRAGGGFVPGAGVRPYVEWVY